MTTTIPEAAKRKHLAILGINGAGKSSADKGAIIEPALKAGERVCVIDPKGEAWGLRLGASGSERGGLPIYIVGGERADFPLDNRSGGLWAEIVGTTSDSFAFDLSLMTVTARSTWFTEFAEALLRKNKGPLNLTIDEIHLFAPQGGAKSGGQTPMMLHATNNLLALGRSKGLRVRMISQRPAKVHKDALTQAHTLVAMMMVAPQDRNAVKDWIADQADAERGKEIIASLPTLKPGEAWVWAPAESFLERVRFPMPKTYDSSRAPDEIEGEAVKLKPIDPAAVSDRLKAVAEDAKANDPARLKAEVARLARELVAAKAKPAAVEIPADLLAGASASGYRAAVNEIGRAISTTAKAAARALMDAEKLMKEADMAIGELERAWEGMEATPLAQARKGRPNGAERPDIARKPAARPAARPSPPREPISGDLGAIPKGERAILIAAAQYPGGVTRQQLTALTGYKRSSRDAYVSRLAAKGALAQDGARLVATPEGIAVLGADYEPLPTGDALREHWLARLPKGEAAVLAVVCEQWPKGVSRDSITERTDYQRSSRDAYVARLKARHLVEAEQGQDVKAVPELFG